MKIMEWFKYPNDLGIHQEIGIEVETEGNFLPNVVPSWNIKHDGSLRGNSKEYVLKAPCSRIKAKEKLDLLYDALKVNGIDDSKRCGVHIHLNVRNNTIEETFNIVI